MADTAIAADQYLTFTLDSEQYAVPVYRVREVMEVLPLTKVPMMPDYMKGIINIRGLGVPVFDLRKRFGFADVAFTVETRIIVVDIDADNATVTIGCLADSVQEVVGILDDQIEPPPRMGLAAGTAEFVNAIGKRNNEFVIMLDIDKVFDASIIGSAAARAE